MVTSGSWASRRYAADELGDVVFVEMPAVGRKVARGETFGVIESVKTASDLYSPRGGRGGRGQRGARRRARSWSTADPYGEGWMVRLRLDDPSAAECCSDADAYRALIGA